MPQLLVATLAGLAIVGLAARVLKERLPDFHARGSDQFCCKFG